MFTKASKTLTKLYTRFQRWHKWKWPRSSCSVADWTSPGQPSCPELACWANGSCRMAEPDASGSADLSGVVGLAFQVQIHQVPPENIGEPQRRGFRVIKHYPDSIPGSYCWCRGERTQGCRCRWSVVPGPIGWWGWDSNYHEFDGSVQWSEKRSPCGFCSSPECFNLFHVWCSCHTWPPGWSWCDGYCPLPTSVVWMWKQASLYAGCCRFNHAWTGHPVDAAYVRGECCTSDIAAFRASPNKSRNCSAVCNS